MRILVNLVVACFELVHNAEEEEEIEGKVIILLLPIGIKESLKNQLTRSVEVFKI